MLDPLIKLLNDNTPLHSSWGRLVVVVGLFLAAWLLARASGWVARIRTGVTLAGFATAVLLSVAQLIGGVDRLTALAGASFVLILAGFAIQRVLMDIIAGGVMFAERWYS